MSRLDVCVLGSLNLDVVIGVEAFPRPGQTIFSRTLAHAVGGKGANQAIAAARVGASTAMIGAVGDDDAGRMLKGALVQAGADVSAVESLPGFVSGTAHVIVDAAGQNEIMVHPGANAEVTPARAMPPAARVYLAQLETPLPALEAFFQAAGEMGGLTILNTAPAVPEAKALFKLAAIVVMNETELETYAGHHHSEGEPCEHDLIALARSLIVRPAQAIVVTLGEKGAIAVTQVSDVGVAARPVTPIDTTGAGDCFCGVLAASLARGMDLTAAMMRANAAAAIAVTRPGAGLSMPTAAELEARP